jgi:hypothetical protein
VEFDVGELDLELEDSVCIFKIQTERRYKETENCRAATELS